MLGGWEYRLPIDSRQASDDGWPGSGSHAVMMERLPVGLWMLVKCLATASRNLEVSKCVSVEGGVVTWNY